MHNLPFLIPPVLPTPIVPRKAIETSRDVWKALLKSEIGIDAVAAALRRMDKHESAAEAVYKAMISRHSTYPKLLQARLD